MTGTARPQETEAERLDRNLEDLLREIRVAMPGVQVLFGFLLAVPFQSRFVDITDTQKGIYFFTLVCSAVATACFIAPTAYHRLVFRRGEKDHLVPFAARSAIAGLIALALAMTAAILLVADLLFAPPAPVVIAALMGAMFCLLWFVLPLRRRRESRGAVRSPRLTEHHRA